MCSYSSQFANVLLKCTVCIWAVAVQNLYMGISNAQFVGAVLSHISYVLF